MKIYKKAFCRTYQAGFRAALPFLPYREPTLIDGFEQVAPVLEKHHISRILLVTDPGVYGLGLTKSLEDDLRSAGIYTAVYSGTCANPTFTNVEEARALYLKENCEGLIAFGGGSAMDCAKAAGARISHPGWSLLRIKGNLHLIHKIPLLIAIPTTAGTGSETTLAALVTDEKTHRKYCINDFHLIPDYAVMEPKVTLGLPPHLTASTGMDAMTHAVEAFIGRSTTPGTRKASIEAIRLIMRNLPKAYHDGGNDQARANMLRASYLAGTAFTKSYVGYVHSMAHSLGGMYGTPHGLANSILLPVVLEEYGPAVHKKLAVLARETGLVSENVQISDACAAKVFIDKIRSMNQELGIPEKLSGILPEDIPTLAANADKDGNPLYPVPVLWDVDVFARILAGIAENPQKESMES